MVDKANRLLQAVATPSIVRLVMRLALAVPFWRSGILKWSGFGKLSDTAVTLFTDEFMLHLPGGPYHFPAPTVMAFLLGMGEILFPVLLVLGLGARFGAFVLLFIAAIVELAVPDGWPNPPYLGCDGAWADGLGTGTNLDRSAGAQLPSPAVGHSPRVRFDS